MGNPYCINYQHVVFRVGKLTIRPCDIAPLHAYIAGVLTHQQVKDVKVGGVSDHVHLIGQFGNKYLADIVRTCKFSTNAWLKKQDPIYYSTFYWRKRYGSFSVSPQHVQRVKNYIANQAQHHAHNTVHDEILHMVDQVPHKDNPSGDSPMKHT